MRPSDDAGQRGAKGPAVSQRLSVGQKLGFGVGDFAFGFFWQVTQLYLLFYYTDVLGLPPSVAGWVFGAAMLWDAVSDPAMGFIANRTRTRWGRYRPYILFGCIPLAVSFTAMFLPTGLEGAALVMFALATHCIFRTLYTVMSMPYSSLMATLTSDSAERGSLAAYRMAFATGAGLVIAFATLKLVQMFGQGDQQKGFLLVAALYGLLSIPLFLITFATTRETVGGRADPTFTLRAAFGMIVRNHAFLLVCGFTIAHYASVTLIAKTLPYIFKYALGREDLIGTALASLAALVFLCIPCWAWIMRRTSKRTVALAGMAVGTISYSALALTHASSLPLLLIILAGVGIANSAGYLSFWSMMPDTVEYGEWRSDVRGEGVIFGVVSFIQKAGLAGAVAVLGMLLEAAGYVANRPQAAPTLENLYRIASLGPLALVLIAAALIYFYPLSPAAHRSILTELEARREARRL